MEDRLNRSANPSVTVLLSLLLPGLGYMYLGLMRRGAEFLLAFLGTIFIISSLMDMAEIGVPLMLVIYFYSIFDAHHLNKALARGADIKDQGILKTGRRPIKDYHIGVLIIVVGAIFLFNRLINQGYISHYIFSLLKDLFVPMFLIAGGILFIIKSRKADSENNPE